MKQKAIETIREVEILIENKFWNTAINRMYYACFYAVSALLYQEKIETSSHSGIRQKFGQHFVKDGIIEKELGRHYTELFDKRSKGDYNDFFDYDEQTVLSLFPKSQKFVTEITALLKV
jgi:uncharacterized protein (UPF0332 family)